MLIGFFNLKNLFLFILLTTGIFASDGGGAIIDDASRVLPLNFCSVICNKATPEEKRAFISGGSNRESLFILPNNKKHHVLYLGNQIIALLLRKSVPENISKLTKKLNSFTSGQRSEAGIKWRPSHQVHIDKFKELFGKDMEFSSSGDYLYRRGNVEIKTKLGQTTFENGILYRVSKNEFGKLTSFKFFHISPKPKKGYVKYVDPQGKYKGPKVFYKKGAYSCMRSTQCILFKPLKKQKISEKNRPILEKIYKWGRDFFQEVQDNYGEYGGMKGFFSSSRAEPLNTLNVNLTIPGQPTTNYHLDKNVMPEDPTLLFATGSMYSGGETVFPGLRFADKTLAVDLKQGDSMFFLSGKIYHGNMPSTFSDGGGSNEKLPVNRNLRIGDGPLYGEFRRSCVLYFDTNQEKSRKPISAATQEESESARKKRSRSPS